MSLNLSSLQEIESLVRKLEEVSGYGTIGKKIVKRYQKRIGKRMAIANGAKRFYRKVRKYAIANKVSFNDAKKILGEQNRQMRKAA